MKLNRTLMIAALVAGSVFAADMAVRAQDSTNTPPAGATPPARPHPRVNFEGIATQLGLSDDQKAKAQPVFQDMMKQIMEVNRDTTLQRPEKGAKIKEIRASTDAKLKEIFTPEQFARWQGMGPGAHRQMTHPAAPGTNSPPQ